MVRAHSHQGKFFKAGYGRSIGMNLFGRIICICFQTAADKRNLPIINVGIAGIQRKEKTHRASKGSAEFEQMYGDFLSNERACSSGLDLQVPVSNWSLLLLLLGGASPAKPEVCSDTRSTFSEISSVFGKDESQFGSIFFILFSSGGWVAKILLRADPKNMCEKSLALAVFNLEPTE